jgi:alanine racemase
MRLRTEIIALRDLMPGDAVGYGGTFRAERPTRIATLPVGYGDGLMRAISNRGAVLVRGCRCPVVGTVSMDLTTVDVTAVPGAAVGDEVVLLGSQGDEHIGAGEIARHAGTLAYEVLTSISRRVPRFYRD